MIKKIKSVKAEKRLRLHKKIRTQVSGTEQRPRLCVFRSNMYIYAQIINDDTQKTLCISNDMKSEKMTKTERAINVGKDIAAKAKKVGINTVVFDRAGFKYGGRIKALADAAREAGLTF